MGENVESDIGFATGQNAEKKKSWRDLQLKIPAGEHYHVRGSLAQA